MLLSLLPLLLDTARADCMMPRAFFSASAHAPLDATVFFFSPPGTQAQPRFTVIDASEAPVPFTAESLGGLLGAWQLKLDAAAPGVLTLSAEFDEETWIYAMPLVITVSDDWQPPAARALAAVENNSLVWACSHQLSTDLKVTGPAPGAWAVEWAASAADWDAGKHQTDWLPGNLYGFFQRPSEGWSRLELGHVSCLGDVFAWGGPDIVARVVAVDADGAHRPLIDAPATIPRPSR